MVQSCDQVRSAISSAKDGLVKPRVVSSQDAVQPLSARSELNFGMAWGVKRDGTKMSIDHPSPSFLNVSIGGNRHP